MVKSSTQRIIDRKQNRIIICAQGTQRKGRTEQLSLENGRAMELKFIRNDAVLKDLAGQLIELSTTKILSTNITQDNRLRARGAKEKEGPKNMLRK